jgi:hypothetical protein
MMNTKEQTMQELEQIVNGWIRNTVAQKPQPNQVQDRKTGESYDPQEAFDRLMNKPEIMASLKRLSIR